MSGESVNGYCPKCRCEARRVYNVGPYHWAVCQRDKLRWCIGANLFSGWRRKSEGDWVANEFLLADYEEVLEPVWSLP